MLQSFGGELSSFGAKDDTCHHEVLSKYMKLHTCFESAGYVGEILKSGNISLINLVLSFKHEKFRGVF